VEEAVGHRLPPGEGVLPLAGLLGRVPPDAPVSLEVPNPAARADPAGWIQRVADATRRLLASAPGLRQTRTGPGPAPGR
jgi:sugar phosphate isomerase/epimerase